MYDFGWRVEGNLRIFRSRFVISPEAAVQFGQKLRLMDHTIFIL